MIFEDQLMEIQSDMISLSLEYVENKAEIVYIYVVLEDGLVSFDVSCLLVWFPQAANVTAATAVKNKFLNFIEFPHFNISKCHVIQVVLYRIITVGSTKFDQFQHCLFLLVVKVKNYISITSTFTGYKSERISK